ncbi:MAG: hypothetical protein NTZ21_19095 [Actinobacteria bacterium]|nr:hypothetical protein [Actinomycetota bacterium]
MRVPDTQYADADGTRIAYQMFGEGPPVLIVSGLLSNVEITWEHELFRRTLDQGEHELKGIDGAWRLYRMER